MKNKILKYDILIVGSGLLGSLLAIALEDKKLKVLVIEKEKISNISNKDQRTLAVNANSRDFLISINLWKKLSNTKSDIHKICINTFLDKKNLIFEDKRESLGSVIFNKDLLKLAHNYLKNKKILKEGVSLPLAQLNLNSIIKIRNQNYSFTKKIIAVGKNLRKQIGNSDYILGSSNHKAYVGFFKHKIKHKNIAYEYFTKNGPLAVLPVPSKTGLKSTFIYSTSADAPHEKISHLLSKKFNSTHGEIDLINKIYSYDIEPHLLNSQKNYKNLIFIGDSFRSIHPVAGQGWNLGIKDIQSFISLINTMPLDSKSFNSIFYSRRKFDSFAFFAFTEIVNRVFENQTPLSKIFGTFGFNLLHKSSFLRKTFVDQAMGRKKLIGQ